MIISKWMKQRRNWQTGKNQWWIHNLHDCRLEMLQKINTFLTPSFTDKWKQNFFLFNQLNLLQYDRVTKNFFFSSAIKFLCPSIVVSNLSGPKMEAPRVLLKIIRFCEAFFCLPVLGLGVQNYGRVPLPSFTQQWVNVSQHAHVRTPTSSNNRRKLGRQNVWQSL